MIDVYWLEQAAADVPPADDWLAAAEAAQLSRLRFAKRRADWRLGRWTAKRAVACYLRLPRDFAAIEIRPAPSGAPEVFIRGQPAPVAISLSHRAGRAACAVGPPGTALGCDIELIEPRSPEFLRDYLTPEEQDLVTGAEDPPRMAVLVWSVKESVLKALHAGLRLDPRSVSVHPAGGPGAWCPLHARYAGRIFEGWWQRTGDFVGTLVACPPPAPPIQDPGFGA